MMKMPNKTDGRKKGYERRLRKRKRGVARGRGKEGKRGEEGTNPITERILVCSLSL